MKKIILHLLCLLLLTAGTQVKAQHFTNFTTANGLPSNNVNGVVVDDHNRKWFGTQDGVARYNDTSWTVYTTANGLIDNYINCIAADVNNNIWVGTDLGVSKFDGTTWTSYTPAEGLVNSIVNFIAGAPDGSVWIGTGSGASHFDGTTWQNYTTANGLPADMISYIEVETGGTVWLGTWLGGLAKFNGSTFTTFTTADSLPGNNISALGIDANNKKWVGTYYGASNFGSDDKWIANYRMINGIFNNFVMDIDFDSKGNVWFGLYDIYTMDPGLSKKSSTGWKSFTVDIGMLNAPVRRIAVDKNDIVWVATGSGVSRLTEAPEGIGNITELAQRIYPNPADGEFHIDGLKAPASLSLRSVNGKELLTQSLNIGANTIDVRNLESGLYILRCTSGNSTYTGKMIIR